MIDRDALLREMEESGNGSIVLALVAADIALRHIAAARAEALGEAKNEAQRIMRLAADSGSTGAVVGAKCVRDAIRALMDPPT
jgi:hypothetical protein